MTNTSFKSIDVQLLQCFAVVAEENNLHRAAARLHMAQPPLSRHIKNLEEGLGLTLFIRHSRGLSLTEDGARVLEIIRPLLQLQTEIFRQLESVAKTSEDLVAMGFTTAFEQGVFTAMEARLRARYGKGLRVTRAPSPKLVRDVRKGRLDAALVALPLDAPELTVMPLHYSEPLLAAVPTSWRTTQSVSLRAYKGKPLFWFRREDNPAFFDYTRGIFAHLGFEPVLLLEPTEHDVLLARIAAGEGMGLLAASFAAIRREGVVFTPLEEGALLHIQLGLVSLPDTHVQELSDVLHGTQR